MFSEEHNRGQLDSSEKSERTKTQKLQEAKRGGFRGTTSQKEEEEKTSVRHGGMYTDIFKSKMIDPPFLPLNLVLWYVIFLQLHELLEFISLCIHIFQGLRVALANIMKHK